MVGEQLTCIWQAVHRLSNGNHIDQNDLPFSQFKMLIEDFSGLNTVNFSDIRFQEFFEDRDLRFETVKEYITRELRGKGATEKMLYDEIELACWEKCKSKYKSHLNDHDVRKMWQISNRLCTQNVFPPKIGKDECCWFFDKMLSNLNLNWMTADVNFPHSGYIFQHWLDMLESHLFQHVDKALVSKCIDEMHCWLVKEIVKFGWMHKRTRKHSNWTSWTHRWFVLTPGKLAYFKSASSNRDKGKKQKGELFITKDSKLEILPIFKGIMRSYPHRFKVSNLPNHEFEFAVENEGEMKNWLACFEEIVDCCKLKTTPVQRLLKKRHEQNPDAERKLERSLQKTVKFKRLPKGKMGNSNTLVNESTTAMPTTVLENDVKEQLGITENHTSIVRGNKEKIKGLFMKIDKDGNGLLNSEEFSMFLCDLGLKLNEKEVNLIFNVIDKDKNGTINYEEFEEYFSRHVLNENGTGACVTALRMAFLQADHSGNGKLDFKEFTECVWEKKRSVRLSTILGAFQDIGTAGKNELDFEDFKQICIKSDILLPAIAEGGMLDNQENRGDDDSFDAFDQQLKNAFEKTDSQDLALYIRDRWKTFASFRRAGANGKVVMTGGHGMVDDLVPGEYNLVDLVCFSDLPPLEPKHTVICDVQWISSNISGKSGKIIFPPDFDGKVETDIATNEHLRYYNCSIADANQEKVSLVYRHGIQDFTYENNYLSEYVTKTNGGAGIEKHEFSHLDCPLVEDSGVFVLAKLVGMDLHVTGFRVPTRHTLYIPGGTIHCNDYLKGTWRTMLSDETDIDHVHLARKTTTDNNVEHFAFEFV